MRRLACLLIFVLGTASCVAIGAPPPEPEPGSFAGEIVSPSDVFLVVGDSRPAFFGEPGDSLDGAGVAAVTTAMRDERPAFVVHTGDIAKRGSDEDAWLQFDADFAPVRDAGIPLYPVLGNHEYMGADGKALANYFARFPDLGRRNAYVRTFRGIRFVMLDSNTDELGDLRTSKQLKWLERRLSEAAADHAVRAVVVVAHHPPFTNRRRPGESAWVRDEVFPVLTRFPKVRMLLAGHVHSYEHFEIDGVHCVVTGGGGSPLDTLRDADEADARPDLYRGPRGFHYLKVRAGDRVVVDVTMQRADGTWFLADRFVL